MKEDIKALRRKYGKAQQKFDVNGMADYVWRQSGQDLERAIGLLARATGMTERQLMQVERKLNDMAREALRDGKSMGGAGRVTIGDYRIVLHADGNYSIQQYRNGNCGLARPNQVPTDILDQLLTQGYSHRDRVQGR